MELTACELYHCRPSELAEEDTDQIMLHLMMVGLRNEAEQKAAKKAAKKGKG